VVSHFAAFGASRARLTGDARDLDLKRPASTTQPPLYLPSSLTGAGKSTAPRQSCRTSPSLPISRTTSSAHNWARAYRVRLDMLSNPEMAKPIRSPHLGGWVFAGSTFRATQVHTGQVVALKVQPIDISYPSNPHERQIYPLLQGGVGMPTLWASGLWGRWDYLAMDLLGNSLDRLYRKMGKNVMDLRSACSIAIQLVRVPCRSEQMSWG
jgi:hypothetical protein